MSHKDKNKTHLILNQKLQMDDNIYPDQQGQQGSERKVHHSLDIFITRNTEV